MSKPALVVTALVVSSCVPGSAPIESAPASNSPTLLSSARAPALDGAQLFRSYCATCHLGGGGLLGSPRTPDLFEDPLPRGDREEAILQSIQFGIDPPRMPAFETGLDANELNRVTDYILKERARHSGTKGTNVTK